MHPPVSATTSEATAETAPHAGRLDERRYREGGCYRQQRRLRRRHAHTPSRAGYALRPPVLGV